MVESFSNDTGEPVDFSADGLPLAGRLHMPAAARPPFVVGSHGLFSSGDSPKQIALARACMAEGIAFFRFDHRGCGASHGRFPADTSLANRCADLFAAIEALLRRTDLASRFGLFGSSFGGSVCIAAASETAASALVVNAAPVRSRALSEPEVAAGAPAGFDASLFREKLKFDLSNRLSGLRAVCIFHGEADRVVPVQSAREIYESAAEPKQLILFEQGDHLMSRRSHQIRFVREAGKWFQRHLLP